MIPSYELFGNLMKQILEYTQILNQVQRSLSCAIIRVSTLRNKSRKTDIAICALDAMLPLNPPNFARSRFSNPLHI